MGASVRLPKSKKMGSSLMGSLRNESPNNIDVPENQLPDWALFLLLAACTVIGLIIGMTLN
jgi:hypothetical protein